MNRIKFIFISIVIAGCLYIPAFAEPLQNDLFVITTPNGVMGKSPVWPKLTVADSSDAFAKKLYETIKSDPKIQEVLKMYQKAQTDSMNRYRAKLVSEGQSTQEIDKLLAQKAKPIYLNIRDGKGTPYMESGSAYIQTYKDGKLETDFQYICPKVKVTKGWEGFAKDLSKPFTASEKQEFLNLVAHETSHAIMKENYAVFPRGINPIAARGHWEGKMTTQQLAFTEGYAEFMGAWFSGTDDFSRPKYTTDIDTNVPKTQKENMKTEGVVAAIFWDIAAGEYGIKDGMNKVQNILKSNKPWTIESFLKDYKAMYPGDSGAIDKIMNENLVPAKERLITCWINLRSANASIANMEKAYANLSWFKNPIQKVKAWWKLSKAKSNAKKMLERYQSMYGYTEAELTSKDLPKPKPVTIPANAAGLPAGNVQKVTVANPSSNPFKE